MVGMNVQVLFSIIVCGFGFIVGLFALLLPQRFWKWFYLGIKPYRKKGPLRWYWRLIVQGVGLFLVVISIIRLVKL